MPRKPTETATTSSSPSPTTAPSSPVPSPSPTPECLEIYATATIVRWSFPSTTVRVSLSNASQAELSNAKVSFKMPRYWVELPQNTYGPDGWECLDTSSVMLGQSTCTTASWAHGSANFDLTSPTMSILSGYPMEITAAAFGVSDFTTSFSTSVVFPTPN